MSNSARRHGHAPWAIAIFLSAGPAVSAQGDAALETALHFFTRDDAAGIVERLDAVRPAPVSPAERARVLATLPTDGEIRDVDPVDRRKLAAVQRILALHGREHVYVIKVVEVRQAAVALHGRAVVLVSKPALALLDTEELQALVAHEIGHEYFWREYYQARSDDDRPSLRRLELFCDGLAIITLRRAGIDHGWLSSALEKIVRYNRHRLGAALNEDHYPPLGARREFAKRLVARLGS